ncbi:MAG: NAD(P)H-hydrate dehydratase [Wenzhouxiangellaceae bacterium]|nr:NAD(P)H-hydrate dehydratase [Wenzhouxiangellaceae bacterium]
MSPLAGALYRPEQVRELDRRAIEDHGIPGYTLMQRAGDAVFRALRAQQPEARRVLVCCGGGNNGGDGYVVARLVAAAGLQVTVLALSARESLRGDAARAAADWQGPAQLDAEPADFDVIVDALFGTGLDREVRDPYAGLIRRINAARRPVFAVDVPSGLNAASGQAMGVAVVADCTVSFIGRKRGLATGQAAAHCGRVLFDDLDVPAAVYAGVDADAQLLDAADLPEWLPPRRADLHKGALGHVLVIGSDHDYPGACLLTARAALRAGSGLVSVATRADHAIGLAGACPEAMWANGEHEQRLAELLARADVIALGPGLGHSDWSRAVWKRALATDRPVVLDADGLNRLAEAPDARGHWVLTPHPGEAARLLSTTVPEIQRDRFASVRELARRFDAVVVLKGAGSLIADPGGRCAVCTDGNPAMATAGMGDALTGIIASLLGQGLDAFEAAAAGVLLHARAGDQAARGRRTLLTGDLIDALPAVLP